MSREITSCVGTSSTTVRRSTRTTCWMAGITNTSPGPATFEKRPRVNTMPRSYSRKIHIAEKSSAASRTRATAPMP
ncbi:hypothetical protein D3C72_1940260 [compost metagenome]